MTGRGNGAVREVVHAGVLWSLERTVANREGRCRKETGMYQAAFMEGYLGDSGEHFARGRYRFSSCSGVNHRGPILFSG